MMERILEQELTRVTAPRELWDRVNAPYRAARVKESGSGRWSWALGAAMLVVAVLAGIRLMRGNAAPVVAQAAGPSGIQSSEGAEVRAWVRARAGLEVPLAGELPASVRLTGATVMRGQAVEIAYRIEGRPATLLVAKTGGLQWGSVSHAFVRRDGKTASWSTRGHSFTLACAMPGDMELACLICHGGGIPHGT